jgi:hypothetical protein
MAIKAELTKLKAFERQARTLLEHIGRFGEDYDSARLAEAVGHLSQAADALYAAHVTLAKVNGQPVRRGQVYLSIEGPKGDWITARDKDMQIPIFTYDDYIRVCGESESVLCSSSMDFPEEYTENPAIIALANQIRG